MLTLIFVCRDLKARTDPCREGSEAAEMLGVPKVQQTCHCEKFVKDMVRGRGIPAHHTCIRELGDLGMMFVVEDEPGVLRIEVRLRKPFSPENLYKMLRYLEQRHGQVLWRQDDEGSGEEPIPLKFEETKPPIVGEPPPEVEEEPTPPAEEEPRPKNIPPEELARRLYRGPIAGPPKKE